MTPKEISKEEVENFKKLIEYLKRLSEDGITSLIEKPLLIMLDQSIPFFSHLVMTDVFPEIHRLTINKRVIGKNKRIREINFLKYPPKEMVSKYGRCNNPKQSILYSSFLNFTAMNESQPRVGDLITKSVWKVKGNQTLTYCPIFKNQPLDKNIINPRTFEINKIYQEKLKQYPENIREQIDLLVQFIADVFTKRIHPDRHLDYLFSAYFSNKILYEFENQEIEAIFYPSVKDKLSFENLAIKPNVFDNKYELVEVSDSVCVMDPTNGRGGFFFEGFSTCKSFDFTSGKILWDKDKIYQSEEKIIEMKNKFDVDLSE
ncbi:hypothetical protein [Pedobacter arcticus]|uniref:hypothetical protein n=1 Tax=Pedobacter arcticus TaxID=752140 RepID=UPI0003180B21|nr:hypothetical protein [Pedobacter arcticus]